VSFDCRSRLRRQQFVVALIFPYNRSDSDRCAHGNLNTDFSYNRTDSDPAHGNPNTDRLEQPPYNCELFTLRRRQHPDGERYRLCTWNVKLPNDNRPQR
jgi:hypothetical protein